MGFHDGVAEKLVLRAFRKYEAASAMARQERSAAGAAADGERLPPPAAAASSSSPPDPCPATPADAPADAAPLPPPDSASEEAQLAAAESDARGHQAELVRTREENLRQLASVEDRLLDAVRKELNLARHKPA